MSLGDLDEYKEFDDDQINKRGWLSSVGKGIAKRSSRMFGTSKQRATDDTGDKVARVMGCRSPLAYKDGGIANIDPEMAKACRSVMSLMLRQMGKNLLKGGAVMNVSFPIQCCQPLTILEIAAKQAG